MKLKQTLLILFLTLIIVITFCKCDKPLSFESLLLEMVDREQFSYYPDPFYITKQFSSYDGNRLPLTSLAGLRTGTGPCLSGKKKNGVIYLVTIPANSTADLFLPEEYFLKKVKLLSIEKSVSLRKNANDGYNLLAGNYEIVLTRK